MSKFGCFACFTGGRADAEDHRRSNRPAATDAGHHMASSNPLFRGLPHVQATSASMCSSSAASSLHLPLHPISTVAVYMSDSPVQSPCKRTPVTQADNLVTYTSYDLSVAGHRNLGRKDSSNSLPNIHVAEPRTPGLTESKSERLPFSYAAGAGNQDEWDDFVSCKGSFSSMASARSSFSVVSTRSTYDGAHTSLPTRPSADTTATTEAPQTPAPQEAAQIPGLPPVWTPTARGHSNSPTHTSSAAPQGHHHHKAGLGLSRFFSHHPAPPDAPAEVSLPLSTSLDRASHQRTSRTSAQSGQHRTSSAKVQEPYPEDLVEDLGVTWNEGGVHVQALEHAAKLYKQCGHPCLSCTAILSHCQSSKIQPLQLLGLLATAPDTVQGVPKEGIARLVRAAYGTELAKSTVMDDSEWEVARDDGLKMMYQHKPHSSVHSFKGRCTLDAPIEYLVALTREFDLCSTWNHYCVESVVLKEWSEMELLCVAVQWMPWPLHNMNIVVEAVGTDMLRDAGGFLVTFSTPKNCKDPELLKATTKAKPNNLQLRMLHGSCVFLEPLPPLKPGGPQRTRATLQVRTDPGIRHVPHMLITWVLKIMGPFIYNIVLKLLKNEFSNEKSPIPARIPTRPFLYGLVKQQAAEFLSRQQQQQAAGQQ